MMNRTQVKKTTPLKAVLLLVVGIVFSFGGFTQSKPSDILGKWLYESGDAKMEVVEQNGKYVGIIMAAKSSLEADGKTSKKDVNNPDESLRNKDVVGMINLKGLHYDDGEYVDGKIYDISTGKTWDCYLEIEGDVMHFTGFIGAKWLGKTVKWNRIQ